MILLGKQYWEMLLYAVLSVNAPRINIDGILRRQTLHVMLCGDISTGKTTVMKIIERIAPKSEWYDDVTKASFEGVATSEGIEDGIIDRLKDAVFLVPEFKDIKLPHKRQFLDNDKIKISKRGHIKEIRPNTVFIAGINPKSDWFINNMNLREQVPQSEGDLSRIDIFLPLAMTKEKMEVLLEKIDLFSDKEPVNLEEYSLLLSDLAGAMSTVGKVVLTKEQKERLKDVFRKHIKELNGTRPLLVILRDYEMLARLVNVIVTANVLNREVVGTTEDGKKIIQAKDEDIDKAIEYFETIIDLRETLYTKETRKFPDLKEKIYTLIVKRGRGEPVKVKELEEVVTKPLPENDFKPLCSRATLYRVISRLLVERRLVLKNERPMEVAPA